MANKNQQADALTPPLKWPGGKRWIVPELQKLWHGHEHRRLVEPFCGGLAVSLGLKPSRALANDINPHLINFYRQIARTGLPVTVEMRNEETLYYRRRDRFNELISNPATADTPEAAQLFYYLNRNGFNGLCRFNRDGRFNVPFGRYTTVNYGADFKAYQQTFAGWNFRCGDFGALDLAPSDFIYADPPYDDGFTTYSAGGFSWADQVRCAEWLARHPGPVALSNKATERIVRLYESHGFELQQLSAPRRISRTGDRTPAAEVLATRNTQAAAQRPVLMSLVSPPVGELRDGGFTSCNLPSLF